jgi:hypothetical protein
MPKAITFGPSEDDHPDPSSSIALSRFQSVPWGLSVAAPGKEFKAKLIGPAPSLTAWNVAM